MNEDPIRRAKGSAQSHKQMLTKIHRVIDAYEKGRRDAACMHDIVQILGRKQEGKPQ